MERITQIPTEKAEEQIIVDPYQVFGVGPDTTFEEIEKLYKQYKLEMQIMARDGNLPAVSKSQEIEIAYQTLKMNDAVLKEIQQGKEHLKQTFKQ